MSLRVSSSGVHAVISVDGEVDLLTAPQLGDALALLTGDGLNLIVVDLTEVSFIDARGLSVLAAARRAMWPDGLLRVASGDELTTRLFSITGLDTVISVHPSLSEALADRR